MSITLDSLSNLGERQQELLRALRRESNGLTVEELAASLGITRTAVNQHLQSLEDKGYITRGALRRSGGRPSLSYMVTSRGLDLFPRRYSWFSSLLLAGIKNERGTERLSSLLKDMARMISESLKDQIKGRSLSQRIKELDGIMGELGYETHPSPSKSSLPIIEAHNCVYHGLAVDHPEICQFDIQLLEDLSGAAVHHEECMVRGGKCCRFRFEEK